MVKKSKDMANLFLAAKLVGGTGGGEQPVLITKSITENGIYSASADSADGYSQVTVNVPAPAPLSPTRSGATIYDFDGSVIATYTPEEFAALTEYPAHPTHEYLTADGYNWSLANAQAYSTKYGYVEVGALYRVTDGKTRLFIHLEEGRLEPQLGLGINGSVDVDWGDGSAHDMMTGSNVSTTVYKVHTYAQAGDYIIALTVTGSMRFNGTDGYGYGYILGKQGGNQNTNRAYLNALQILYIGDNVTSIGSNAFYNCSSLTSVSIPDNVTSIGSSAFHNCYGLGFIKFTSETPPTVANANTWTGIPTDCIIYVPQGTLFAYTSATNYPDPATYTYVEY